MSDAAVWIAVVSALLNCFFSAANYALLDFSRARLTEMLESRGQRRRLDQILEMQDGLLLLTAIARTLFNLLIMLAMLAAFLPTDRGIVWSDLVLPLIVAGLIIAVFGVAIPLSWSRHAAEPLLAASMPVLRPLYVVSKPLLIVLHWFDPLIRRLLGVPLTPLDTTPVEQEILDAVTEGEKSGAVDEEQKEMIEAVVEFPTLTVEQIMTPRTDVEGIEVNSSLDDVKRIVVEIGHSRIPVYEGDLDHIVGMLYVKDLIGLLGAPAGNGFDLRTILREAVFVPETKPLRDLLAQFKASKVHMAIVLDEYGGTAGLITIEDVLEEIVGEISDEYERPEPEPSIHRISERAVEVDGRVYVDDVNDELGIEIPDDEDYDTIGGFVFSTMGRIPEAGETLKFEDMLITITDAEKTRVNKVRIERLDAAAAEPATRDRE